MRVARQAGKKHAANEAITTTSSANPKAIRFEKCISFDPTRSAVFQLVTGVESLLHRDRNPKTEGISDEGAVKFFRRDADDRVLNPVEILRSADDVRIAAVTILPRPVSDHRHGMRLATFTFLRCEAAPENGLYSERVEIIR